MLNVVLLDIIKQNVIMLSVVMLSAKSQYSIASYLLKTIQNLLRGSSRRAAQPFCQLATENFLFNLTNSLTLSL
jgi:hypothetical protein